MIVLDTHVWIWWVSRSEELSSRVRKLLDDIAEPEFAIVSSISVWEAALLHQRGRLRLSMPLDNWLSHSESLPFLRFVPVDNRIAARSVLLPEPLHRDPADRIIVATALQFGATLVTRDEKLRSYSAVDTVW